MIANTILLAILVLCAVMYGKKKSEAYDYEQENPNALIQGRNVAGTVYSADPDNVPGLGWII